MAAHRNHRADRARHQIDARHVPGLRDATGIDADELREGITALGRRALSRTRFPAAEHRDVRHGSIVADHRGDRQHAQRNRLDQPTAVGVENGERVVGRERQHSDPMTGSVHALRDCGGSGDVVA